MNNRPLFHQPRSRGIETAKEQQKGTEGLFLDDAVLISRFIGKMAFGLLLRRDLPSKIVLLPYLDLS